MTFRRIFKQEENPFDLTKASDFTDTQIFNYWVDMVSDHGGLLGVLNPKSVMPMLLLGGKGSGKTHLMRYCSAPVQAIRHKGNLKSAVAKEGYIGIYARADGLNVGRFAGKGQSPEVWSSIFSFYFELWLILNLISILNEQLYSDTNKSINEISLTKEICKLFDTPPKSINNLKELSEHLEKKLRTADGIINNCAISRTLSGIEIDFSPGKLCFGIPQIISNSDTFLTDTIFVYLIDEVENFSIDQQKFLNSLIRYRSGNSTIRVGARLYGIKTYATTGAGEPIKISSEYDKIELDNFLRAHNREYSKLAQELVLKRLNEPTHEYIENKNISEFFESISSENFYKESTEKLITSRKSIDKDRPYFEKLKKHLSEIFGKKSEKIDLIIENLRVKDYALIEKLNILQLYKNWGDQEKILKFSEKIKHDAEQFIKSKPASNGYTQTYEHFDSDLLAQLYRDYGRKIPYVGVETLIHLSQGVPRNFLGVLKQIYRRSLFAGEMPFAGGIISAQSQTEGVMDSAAWFWDDAQPDSYGTDVRESIERLATLMRSIRYSDKPSECDLCAFSIDESKISVQSKLTLERAENWSYLVRIRDGSKNKNTQNVDLKFQLSPMLAPKWGLSVHRRGTLEIRTDLANAIFDKDLSSSFDILLKSRISAMQAPKFSASSSSIQEDLF